MQTIRFEQIPDWFACVGALFAEKKEELCAMDARFGDGDLGLTMEKGFTGLPDLMRAEMAGAEGDCGKLLMKGGMKMSSLVPSTMGFLMSSGIMEGGKAIKGKTEIDASALAEFLNGYAAGVAKRGKCQVGQRTLYDALEPAGRAALECAAQEGAALIDVMEAACAAARGGLEKTRDMIPVFGKAAVHAAACAGEPDQGALAGCYLLEGMRTYISG